jgi:hypothetical protein
MKAFTKFMCVVAVAIFAAVQARAAVVLSDDFSYPDGDLVVVSGGVWTNHSGTTPINVVSQEAIVSGSNSQDDNRMLSGGPYGAGSVLYASFTVNFSIAPSAATTYFAHFKDSTTFNFFGRVFGTNDGGMVQMGIGNSSSGIANATSGYAGSPFAVGTTHTIVIRLDQTGAAAVSTIWVDPTLESDPSGTASDAAGIIDVEAFALRQSTGEGTVAVDNLLVGTSFADVIPEPSTVMLVGAGLVGLLAIRRRRA